tara:strand:+ start:1943 stop:3643 length:1701 start_codon:yes stop_codon:yes gene_type:complete
MPNQAFQKSLRSKDKDKFVASLRYGGIPMAATGIGIEEIKVTHADGGGGRDFGGFRGSGKEYAMNYEPSRGGVEQGSTGSQQPKEEPKEETPEIEEIVVTSVRENFNSFMNEENPVFNYSVTNFLNPESLQSISSFTQGNDNVSEIDVYSILFAESSGGQRENPAASGPLQVQLGAFIDSQRHQNIYGPVPPKDTPEHKIYMEKAEKDFNALDQTGYVETGLNYLESLNQRFERNNKRKPTIEESALLYTEGYKGGMKYIEGEKNWRESTKLKVYIPNVLKAYTALTVKDSAINFEEGGTPWGGATGTIYEEPSGPKPLQQQMINAFSEGGISEDKPSLKKKASFAPFLDTGKGALEFAGALTGPIGMASFLGKQIASGEGYSGEPLSGNNTAGMNVTGGNVESGRGIRSATTATPDTIVRQPETEQDYEERVSVYDNSIKEKQELEQYFKDNFSNPNAGKEFEYEGTKYIESSVETKSLSELNELNQDLINKKLIKLEYVTQNGPVKSFVSIKDLHLMLEGDDLVESYIAGLAFDGLGQGKSTVVDPKNKNSITVKFTSTIEESI